MPLWLCLVPWLRFQRQFLLLLLPLLPQSSLCRPLPPLWWLLLLCRPLKWQPLRSVGAPGFAAALALTPTSGRSKREPQRYVARLSDAKPALLPLALVQHADA